MGEILMKKYMKTLLMEALGTQIVVRHFFMSQNSHITN
jgi:hypothetical protein